MKSRIATTPAEKSSLTWIVVPLSGVVITAVVGLALFGAEPRPAAAELGGGPLLERPPAAEAPTAPVAAPAPAADEPLTLSSASRLVPIEVYTASWCTACASAERWMDANDIAYSEIDVDRSAGAREQLVALNPRRTLPTFDVAGDVLVGFDPGRLGAAIEGAAARRHLR